MIIWNLCLQSRCESWPVVNTCINSGRGDVHEIDAERVVKRRVTETLDIPEQDRWGSQGGGSRSQSLIYKVPTHSGRRRRSSMPLFPVHRLYRRMSAAVPTVPLVKPTPERAAELREALEEIRQRVQAASSRNPSRAENHPPVLVAVSKYKPASDVLAAYEDGQRDFGEIGRAHV